MPTASPPIQALSNGAPPAPRRKILGFEWLIALAALALAIYVAGTKSIGLSADIRNYEILYDIAATSDWFSLRTGEDPAFYLLSKLAAEIGLTFTQFAFALAAVTCVMKARILQSIDTNRVILAGLYFSYLFWLHEYTQIRLAIGLTFVLWGIYRSDKLFWLYFFVGVLFHSSTAIVVAAFLFMRYPRLGLIGVVVAGFFSLTFDLFRSFIEAAYAKVFLYQALVEQGQFSDINIFSLMPLIQGIAVLLAIPLLKGLSREGRHEWAFSVFGTIMFYAFTSTPVIAFRTSELSLPFFAILLSRLWSRHLIFKGIAIIYVLLGLRSAFFSASSLIIL